jgi:hypothetical protein
VNALIDAALNVWKNVKKCKKNVSNYENSAKRLNAKGIPVPHHCGWS